MKELRLLCAEDEQIRTCWMTAFRLLKVCDLWLQWLYLTWNKQLDMGPSWHKNATMFALLSQNLFLKCSCPFFYIRSQSTKRVEPGFLTEHHQLLVEIDSLWAKKGALGIIDLCPQDAPSQWRQSKITSRCFQMFIPEHQGIRNFPTVDNSQF